MKGHKIDDLSYYQHGNGLKLLADEIVGQIDHGVESDEISREKALSGNKNDSLATHRSFQLSRYF